MSGRRVLRGGRCWLSTVNQIAGAYVDSRAIGDDAVDAAVPAGERPLPPIPSQNGLKNALGVLDVLQSGEVVQDPAIIGTRLRWYSPGGNQCAIGPGSGIGCDVRIFKPAIDFGLGLCLRRTT